MSTLELRAMRWVLAVIWLVTGFVSLWVFPEAGSLHLLAMAGLTGHLAMFALYGGAILDLLLGVLTLFLYGRWLWRTQALVILVYSAIISIALPIFWTHPFGPILKNLPILLLLWLLDRHCKGSAT